MSMFNVVNGISNVQMPLAVNQQTAPGFKIVGNAKIFQQQQAPMPTALPVAHSATPIGQHAMGPQGAIPTGPQGMHQSLPQGQAYYQQRQNEIAAAQQAQANQQTLASALRNMNGFRFGNARLGFGGE